MTLNNIMAIILHYITEFGNFGGEIRHSGWSYTHIVCNKKSRTKNL